MANKWIFGLSAKRNTCVHHELFSNDMEIMDVFPEQCKRSSVRGQANGFLCDRHMSYAFPAGRPVHDQLRPRSMNDTQYMDNIIASEKAKIAAGRIEVFIPHAAKHRLRILHG